MDDGFEIEIQEDQSEPENRIRLPANFLPFGEIENDDVKVYIKQDVYKALEKYALSDTSTELGTILLGDHCEDLGKTHVVISNYIEAKYTDASASTLTFTHETWEYVHAQHGKLYPDTRIVGWQHTHPSYGIFLSNYDLFIQENFFDLPFQVAYVIDPVQNLRGFFQWKNGRIEKLRGFYIYDDAGKPIKTAPAKKAEKPAATEPRRSSGALSLLLLALFLVSTAVLGFTAFRQNARLRTQQAQYETLEQTVARQEQEIALLRNTPAPDTDELTERIRAQQATIDEQGKTIADLEASVQRLERRDADSVVFIRYRVQPGDTLARICGEQGLDLSASLKTIVSVNGLADANKLRVGQELLLPSP